VILPKATERDLDLQDIPEDVRSEPTFVQVETVEEILKRGAGTRIA
jgi:ATP-dependent Lon protease